MKHLESSNVCCPLPFLTSFYSILQRPADAVRIKPWYWNLVLKTHFRGFSRVHSEFRHIFARTSWKSHWPGTQYSILSGNHDGSLMCFLNVFDTFWNLRAGGPRLCESMGSMWCIHSQKPRLRFQLCSKMAPRQNLCSASEPLIWSLELHVAESQYFCISPPLPWQVWLCCRQTDHLHSATRSSAQLNFWDVSRQWNSVLPPVLLCHACLAVIMSTHLISECLVKLKFKSSRVISQKMSAVLFRCLSHMLCSSKSVRCWASSASWTSSHGLRSVHILEILATPAILAMLALVDLALVDPDPCWSSCPSSALDPRHPANWLAPTPTPPLVHGNWGPIFGSSPGCAKGNGDKISTWKKHNALRFSNDWCQNTIDVKWLMQWIRAYWHIPLRATFCRQDSKALCKVARGRIRSTPSRSRAS